MNYPFFQHILQTYISPNAHSVKQAFILMYEQVKIALMSDFFHLHLPPPLFIGVSKIRECQKPTFRFCSGGAIDTSLTFLLHSALYFHRANVLCPFKFQRGKGFSSTLVGLIICDLYLPRRL